MRFHCSNHAGRRAQAQESMHDITRICAEENDELIRRHLDAAYASLETAAALLAAEEARVKEAA